MLTHFNYWQVGYGWAEVFFTSESQAARFEFSYLSDPLAELIEAITDFLENSRDYAEINFLEEPGCYRLILSKIGGEVKIELRSDLVVGESSSIPTEWAAITPFFQTSDTLENIGSVIKAGIIDLRNRHSDAEYLEQWGIAPFPIEKFNNFVQALLKRMGRNAQ